MRRTLSTGVDQCTWLRNSVVGQRCTDDQDPILVSKLVEGCRYCSLICRQRSWKELTCLLALQILAGRSRRGFGKTLCWRQSLRYVGTSSFRHAMYRVPLCRQTILLYSPHGSARTPRWISPCRRSDCPPLIIIWGAARLGHRVHTRMNARTILRHSRFAIILTLATGLTGWT